MTMSTLDWAVAWRKAAVSRLDDAREILERGRANLPGFERDLEAARVPYDDLRRCLAHLREEDLSPGMKSALDEAQRQATEAEKSIHAGRETLRQCEIEVASAERALEIAEDLVRRERERQPETAEAA